MTNAPCASDAASFLLDLVVGVVKNGVVSNVKEITAAVTGGKAQPSELVTVRCTAHILNRDVHATSTCACAAGPCVHLITQAQELSHG